MSYYFPKENQPNFDSLSKKKEILYLLFINTLIINDEFERKQPTITPLFCDDFQKRKT
jgi:hypothetical protein